MKNINLLIRFFASASILLASVVVFNACTSNDPKPPVQTITGFSPASAVQGATVVITGTNFSTTASNNVVAFNGITATVTEATSTQLTTTVPVGATTGKLTVQIGAVVASSADDYVYMPTITVSTLAGSGVAGLTDGTGIAAKLQYPTGVVMDASGNLFVAEMDNNIIRKITPDGVATIFAGSPSGLGSADGTGTAASFGGPYGLAIDASGNLFVADVRNHRIRKITSSGVVTTIAGSSDGYSDGNGIAAKFYYPCGVALDATGNLYVADEGNQRIRKITPNGDVTTFAGSGARGFADGTGTAAIFNNPNGLALDAVGNMYVADYNNNRIRKITASGVVTTLAGSAAGFADGTGTAAQFDFPAGVTVDASGNVFVADRNNNRVRKITSGGVVTTLAGNSSGFADGIGAVAKFNSLQGICISPSGELYIADSDNHRVRKIKIK